MINKKLLPLIVAIATVFTLFGTACSKVPEEPVKENNNSAPEIDIKDEKPEIPEETGPEFVNPLTGEETDTDISGNRPCAFMINNIRIAQPQLGISKADIIWEAPVEGGITRMMAVFQDVSDVETIGSLRSSRHYYLDLAKAYDAIYIHAGGSERAYSDIDTRGVSSIDGVRGSAPIFYRDEYRRSAMGYEHSLCTTGQLVTDYLPDCGYDLTHDSGYSVNMKFTEDGAPSAGSAASDITVDFGSGKTTSFSYDASDKSYYASQYDAAYTDGNDDTQVSVKNVVVIQTSVWTMDDYGRLDMVLTGTGSGYFMSGGKYEEITWSRADDDSQFEFTYADGSEVEYTVGQTYYCIISESGGVTFA